MFIREGAGENYSYVVDVDRWFGETAALYRCQRLPSASSTVPRLELPSPKFDAPRSVRDSIDDIPRYHKAWKHEAYANDIVGTRDTL